MYRVATDRTPVSHLRASWLAAVLMNLLPIVQVSAQVLHFVQTTDTIQVPYQTILIAQATFEARIKVPAGGTPDGGLYHEQCHAVEDKGLHVIGNAALGSAWTSFEYGPLPRVDSGPIADGQWHHVAFVRDGGEERFYLDGVLSETFAWNPPIANSDCSGPLSLGASQFGYYFPAPRVHIDWLRLSKTARYVGGSSPVPACQPESDPDTLLLFWFDDAPGSGTARDSGPFGADGILGVGFVGATAPAFEPGDGQGAPNSGDIDGDTDVDLIDADILVDVLVGLDGNPIHIARADINCDGAENGLDIQPFLRALLVGI